LPNLTGTVDLLRLAENSPNFKGFLFLSSSEVYGECNSLNPIKEEELGRTDIFHPRSVYSESKRAGELVCRVWERSNNLPIAIARPFHTYGIGLKSGDGRAFADIDGLRGLLLADPDALARSFVKQILMYATGTDIHYSDRLAIERIVAASREHGHGLRSLFHEIAASQLFRGK
jgi:nucleoside-diphosphate-sugar epimerase